MLTGSEGVEKDIVAIYEGEDGLSTADFEQSERFGFESVKRSEGFHEVVQLLGLSESMGHCAYNRTRGSRARTAPTPRASRCAIWTP